MSKTAVKGLFFNIGFQSLMLMLDLDFRVWFSVVTLFPLFVLIDIFFVWSSRQTHRYYQDLIAAIDRMEFPVGGH